MRYAVIGAGGIGTLVAVLLVRAGADVVLYARPEAAAAIERDGARVEGPLLGDAPAVRLAATADPAALRPDVAIVCVKAHQLEGIVASCGAALAAARSVVVMQNGLPWWYFAGIDGPHAGRAIAAADPAGKIAAALPVARTLGGVVEAAGLLLAPGVTRTGALARFTVGAPGNHPSADAEALAAALTAGGGQGVATSDIRLAVWRKLLGNIGALPISALTRAVPAEFCADAEIYQLLLEIMRETVAVAAGLGVDIGVDVVERIEGTRKVGTHPPSMLQDLLAGKKLELDALTGATIELGTVAGVPTPSLRRVDALVRLLERSLERRP